VSITIIKARRRVAALDFHEIWEYRDLLFALGTRDVKVRYKQTFIGVAWAVIQPFVTMIVYAITFGRFAGVPSDGIPYPIFAFTGLCFWTLFSTSLSNASDSLVANEGIIKKVYFPRLIAPLASTIVCSVDFLCSVLCLAAIAAYYRMVPSLLGLFLIPVLALWTILTSLGLGWFLAAVNVKYRDVRYALPFFIQLLVFVSPVIYPARIFREYAWILALNPMTGVIETARYTLLGSGTVSMPVIATSLGMSVVFLVGGYLYFQNTEKTLADVL
jgi:lipopolysaccharide transport system permease protein